MHIKLIELQSPLIGVVSYRGEPSSRKSSRVFGGRGREVGDAWPPPGVLSQNWDGNEPNRTVICMVLKATANERRHLALFHDEFRGPQSGFCRSGGISNNRRIRLCK
ncbi:uncharacterized protein TNCV_613591 [Trichonephila clavipes]|nr:uncharacterized protein TNCV_613591 [Trichonephila clavipes]